jgi:hypothetical protein
LSSVKPMPARASSGCTSKESRSSARPRYNAAAAHVPQERFGLLENLVFVAREHVVLDEIGGVFDVIEIFADPVERLQIAQSALAFLDIGLDEIAAFALPQMPLVALGELGLDEILAVARGDLGPEFLAQFVVETLSPHR